jgi:Helix-turn-helix domain
VRGIGIGPALRKARLLRGKSIEEASRETRIRPEYLQALERESFESLIGDVYARGFLRSYSSYLGLDADKVLVIYNRHFGPPRPTLPEPLPGPVRGERTPHGHLPEAMRHHPSWAFLIGVALLALAVFGAAGLLSRSRSTPRAETQTAPRPTLPVLPTPVTVAMNARGRVSARITVDGAVVWDNRLLRPGQGLSWEGSRRIDVALSRGGLVQLVVNGYAMGTPGSKRLPYRASFTPLDFRRSTSTSNPSPGSGTSPGR